MRSITNSDLDIKNPKSATYHFWHYLIYCLIYFNNMYIRYNLVSIQAELSAQLHFTAIEYGVIISFFNLPFTLFSFMFGILGDRFNRKKLMVISLVAQILGLFLFYMPEIVTLSNHSLSHVLIYRLFLLARSFLALGQSGWSSVALTVISDMYTDASERSSKVGIYCIIGSLGGPFSFVITPLIARPFGYANVFVFNFITCVILLGFYMKIPNYLRGQGEGLLQPDKNESSNDHVPDTKSSTLSFPEILADIKAIFKVPTYCLTTLACFWSLGGTEVGVTFISEAYRREFVWLHLEPICSEDMVGLNTSMQAASSVSKFLPGTAKPTFESCQDLSTRLQELNHENLTLNFDCSDCISTQISSMLGMLITSFSILGCFIGLILYRKFYSFSKKSGCLTVAFGDGVTVLALAITYYRGIKLQLQSQLESWVYAILIFTGANFRVGVLGDSVKDGF